MAGDPTNARLWAGADVYVAFDPDTAVVPADADTAFDETWEVVGLLNGDDGFVDTISQDETDIFAWGQILMRTSRKNFKFQKKFTAYEVASPAVFRLRWPGSTQGSSIVVPVVERIKIAFETREGDVVHRVISSYEAEVSVDGDVTENEADVSSVPFVATIFPNTEMDPAELFIEQSTETGS